MTVSYNGYTVSDPQVRAELDRIAEVTGRDVQVTSGDRNFVPRGGARNSDHLHKRAADFHLQGLTDEAAFALLRRDASTLFSRPMIFQLIRHGPHTQTQGAHIHLGRPTEGGPRCGIWTEGLTPESRGHYDKVG